MPKLSDLKVYVDCRELLADRSVDAVVTNNVASLATQAFWRPADQSPSGQGYHWNFSAKPHHLIGEAMGMSMKPPMDVK